MSLAEVLRKHLYFDPLETMEQQQPPFNLVKYLDTLSETETLPPPTPEHVYRTSHAIKLCPREEVLKFKHQVSKTQRISAKLRRTFDFGENFHLMIQNDTLGKSGYLIGDWVCVKCEKEVLNRIRPNYCGECRSTRFDYRELTPSSEEYGISAHVDGVLLVNGKKKILELKTANAMSFKLITEIHKQPSESHVQQINMYMWLTGIHEGIILYFDKNESQICAWDEKFNIKYIQKILDNVKSAREGMRTGELPKREVCDSITCTRAKSCPVSKLCFQ